ncbi:MAG: hypothetical protein U0939_20440 [Pirellulales bacterium]
MAQSNIQVLFSRISVADIREYLVGRGWNEDIPLEADTLRFTTTGNKGAEEAEIWIAAQDADARFRRRVPDVLFTLCLHEDRPALDIANEMFGLGQKALARARAEANHDATGRPAGMIATTEVVRHIPITARETRWSFGHRGADSVLVHLRPHGGMHTIEPGDRLLLVAPPETPLRPSGCLFDVEWSDSVIRIDGPDAAPGPRLFLGLIDAMQPNHLEGWIRRELSELPSERGEDAPDALFESLLPTIRRVAFELQPGGSLDASQQQAALRQATLRQAAVLTAALSRRLPITTLGRRTLWRVALRVLACAGLALELDAGLLEELAITALNDPAESPLQTLELLQRATV